MARETEGAAARLDDLVTPRLLLDADRLRANIARMAQAGRAAGLPLRVHLKTAKFGEAARMLQEEGVGRVAVSTVAEATFFAEAGLRDILYTTPATPAKVAPLLAAGAAAVIESLEMARLLDAAAATAGGALPVMIEQRRKGELVARMELESLDGRAPDDASVDEQPRGR